VTTQLITLLTGMTANQSMRLTDPGEATALANALPRTKANFDEGVALGNATWASDAAVNQAKGAGGVGLILTSSMREFSGSAISELDGLCAAGTIFASNTSSLTIAEMAGATKRADRFVGLHFFNPVPLMALVEVVRTVTTSDATFKRAFAFAASLGKEPVAAKDNSGFIVNLLLVPYLLDAIRAVERGVASVPDIDKAMQLGCRYPMGPLSLLDFVGLDTTHHIAEIMFKEYREARYAPPPLLKRMVLAGMNGQKAGKGFYDYSSNPPTVSNLGL